MCDWTIYCSTFIPTAICCNIAHIYWYHMHTDGIVIPVAITCTSIEVHSIGHKILVSIFWASLVLLFYLLFYAWSILFRQWICIYFVCMQVQLFTVPVENSFFSSILITKLIKAQNSTIQGKQEFVNEEWSECKYYTEWCLMF